MVQFSSLHFSFAQKRHVVHCDATPHHVATDSQ